MKGKSLLIVDDQEHVRKTLSKWFERSGAVVECAPDGHDAITLCSEKSYDILIMDVEMPRVNGLDALRTIRDLHPSVPVILLTGYSTSNIDIEAYEHVRIVYKPSRLQQLEDTALELLAEPNPS